MSKLNHQWFDLRPKRKSYEDQAALQGGAFKVKTFGGDSVGLELKNGDFIATICTSDPDDENEVLMPKMLDLTRFNRVQAVHLEHDIEALPIGRCKWLKCNEKEMIAKYFISQATPETRAINTMLQEGVLHMHSVSYLGPKAISPTQSDLYAHPEWQGKKIYKSKQLMVEFSVTGQPANKECDMIAIGKSLKLSNDQIQRLIGVTSKSILEAEKIVLDITKDTNQPMSADEMKRLIGKRLELVTGNLNYDLIMKRAMRSLGGQ